MELNNNKIVVKTPKERLVNTTFYITYTFLLMTAIITFIEAMRTSNSSVRHILNLEACIAIVTALFYKQFMKKLNQYSQDRELNYKEINITRYTGWMITKPIMLLGLCLVFGYNNKTSMNASYFLMVILINFIMLSFGYIGEIGMINKRLAQLVVFIFILILYGLIYYTFIHDKHNFDNTIFFWAFVCFWFLYGILYDMDEETKIIGYNMLDIFSKCFVGIFLWAYLTGVIKIFN
jgi:bacteriorhodopsin